MYYEAYLIEKKNNYDNTLKKFIREHREIYSMITDSL